MTGRVKILPALFGLAIIAFFSATTVAQNYYNSSCGSLGYSISPPSAYFNYQAPPVYNPVRYSSFPSQGWEIQGVLEPVASSESSKPLGNPNGAYFQAPAPRTVQAIPSVSNTFRAVNSYSSQTSTLISVPFGQTYSAGPVCIGGS